MDFATLAIEYAPLGITMTEHRVIRACNPAFAAMFGGEAERFRGMELSRLYPSIEEYEAIGQAGLQRMRATPLYHDERIMRRLDGQLFWCRVQGRSLRPDEPFALAVWTFADLSAERPVLDLTRRERDVAIRTCQGRTAKEIARDLDLSPRTVEQYCARLFQKTGARNKAELVAVLAGVPF